MDEFVLQGDGECNNTYCLGALVAKLIQKEKAVVPPAICLKPTASLCSSSKTLTRKHSVDG
jgi:hypothetical protein